MLITILNVEDMVVCLYKIHFKNIYIKCIFNIFIINIHNTIRVLQCYKYIYMSILFNISLI